MDDALDAPPPPMTRQEVALRLGVSESSVRRLEGDALHPIRDERGRLRYDRAEVEALRSAQPIEAPDAPEDVAHALAHLEQGGSAVSLVTELGMTVEQAERAVTAWNRLRELEAKARGAFLLELAHLDHLAEAVPEFARLPLSTSSAQLVSKLLGAAHALARRGERDASYQLKSRELALRERQADHAAQKGAQKELRDARKERTASIREAADTFAPKGKRRASKPRPKP